MDLSLGPTIASWEAPTLGDFDTSNVEIGQRIGGKKNRQFVRFYNQTFQVFKAKLDDKGKIIGRELVPVVREMVEIITPGDKNVAHDVATEYHRREFWVHYKNFRDGKTRPPGKDIDECDWLPATIATELRYLGVHTQEQLADASDALCDRVPSGWELREYARQICEVEQKSGSDAKVVVLQSELSEAQRTIEEQGRQIAEMRAMFESLSGGQMVPEESATRATRKKG